MRVILNEAILFAVTILQCLLNSRGTSDANRSNPFVKASDKEVKTANNLFAKNRESTKTSEFSKAEPFKAANAFANKVLATNSQEVSMDDDTKPKFESKFGRRDSNSNAITQKQELFSNWNNPNSFGSNNRGSGKNCSFK